MSSETTGTPGFWISGETAEKMEDLVEELCGLLSTDLSHDYWEELSNRCGGIRDTIRAQAGPKP